MRYAFEECVVDTDAFELQRAGEPVDVEPQVFDVLLHLLRHRDRLVTRDELLDEVWGDRFVSASALNSRLKAARRAIGDDGRAQRLIRTVHGRGYRFVGPVVERSADPSDVEPSAVLADVEPSVDPADVGAALGAALVGAPTPAGDPAAPPPAPGTGPGAVGRASAVGSGRARWPFTGRPGPLQLLSEAHRRGEGGAVLIGPAGVGKTRLADEVLAIAEQEGHPTARAVGHASASEIPLGALAHLLPAGLVAGVGIGDDERTALFHAARREFAATTAGRRMLLFVDDVNLLDDTSVALLVPLALSRRIFLLGTVRSEHAPSSGLAGLVRDGHLLRVDLAPLTIDETGTLLERALGGPPTARALAELQRLSGGNLQIVTELVRGARERDALVLRDERWELVGPLASTVQLDELVGERLADVDRAGREVLEVLAVCERFGIADLETEFGPEILDGLEADGLVDVVTSRRRADLRLAHPLYGEVLAAQLPRVRLRTIRRRLADMVERHGGRRREDQVRPVLWRLDSGGSVEPERVLRAARVALLGHDPTLARRLALAVPEEIADPVRAERLQVLAETSTRLGDIDEAIAALEAATALDVSDVARGQLAIRLADIRFFAARDLDGALVACGEAARLVTDVDTRAALDAHRAVLLATAGRPVEALDVIESLPDRLDRRVQVDVAAARSGALISIGRCREGAEVARRAAADHAALPGWLARRGIGRHLVNEAHALGYAGHLRAAKELLEPAAERALAAGATPAWVWFEMTLGEVARDRGRAEETVRRCRAVVDAAPSVGQEAVLAWAIVGIAQGHLLAGRCAEAAMALDAAEASSSPIATSRANLERARAWLEACRGDLLSARARLLAAATDVRADGVYLFEASLLHDVARFGDADAVVDRLAELGGQLDGPLFELFARHARALAAGDAADLERCMDGFESLDSLAFAAEAAAELAQLLADTDTDAAGVARRHSAWLAARAGGVATPPLDAASHPA